MNVENKAFPLKDQNSKEYSDKKSPMQIVGHCTECGSPIYGYVRLNLGEEPKTERSCSCFAKEFSKTIHHK